MRDYGEALGYRDWILKKWREDQGRVNLFLSLSPDRMHSIIEDIHDWEDAMEKFELEDPKGYELALMRYNLVLEIVKEGDLYWVYPDIEKFIIECSRSFPSSAFTLDKQSVLTKSGCAMFSDGVFTFDNGDNMKAVIWECTDNDDAIVVTAIRHVRELGIPLPRDQMVLRFDREYSLYKGDTYNSDNDDIMGPQIALTLIEFLRQRILLPEKRQPSRAARRRARSPEHIPTVNVVTLRTAEHVVKAHMESMPVEWQHRWIVSGHWRNQWYPSEGLHHPKWIAPYIKGPDDKPLIPKDRFFRVTR